MTIENETLVVKEYEDSHEPMQQSLKLLLSKWPALDSISGELQARIERFQYTIDGYKRRIAGLEARVADLEAGWAFTTQSLGECSKLDATKVRVAGRGSVPDGGGPGPVRLPGAWLSNCERPDLALTAPVPP